MNRPKRKRSMKENNVKTLKTSTPISEKVFEPFPSFKQLSVIKRKCKETVSKRVSSESTTCCKNRKKRKKSKGSFSTHQNIKDDSLRQVRKAQLRVRNTEESDSFSKVFMKRAFLEQSTSNSKDLSNSLTSKRCKPPVKSKKSISNTPIVRRTCYKRYQPVKSNVQPILSTDTSLSKNANTNQKEQQPNSDSIKRRNIEANALKEVNDYRKCNEERINLYPDKIEILNDSCKENIKHCVEAIPSESNIGDKGPTKNDRKVKAKTTKKGKRSNKNQTFSKERHKSVGLENAEVTQGKYLEPISEDNIEKREEVDHPESKQRGNDSYEKFQNEVNERVKREKCSIPPPECEVHLSGQLRNEIESLANAETSTINKKDALSASASQKPTLSSIPSSISKNADIEIDVLVSSEMRCLRAKRSKPQDKIPAGKTNRKKSSASENLLKKVLMKRMSGKIQTDEPRNPSESEGCDILLEEKENFTYPSTSTPFDSPEVPNRNFPSLFSGLSPIREGHSKVYINKFEGNEISEISANVTYGKNSRSVKDSKQEALWYTVLNLESNDTFKNSTSVQPNDKTAAEPQKPREDFVLFQSPPRKWPLDDIYLLGRKRCKKIANSKNVVKNMKLSKGKQNSKNLPPKFKFPDKKLEEAVDDFEEVARWTLSTENVPYTKHDSAQIY